jgi:hypothetical protein
MRLAAVSGSKTTGTSIVSPFLPPSRRTARRAASRPTSSGDWRSASRRADVYQKSRSMSPSSEATGVTERAKDDTRKPPANPALDA